MFHSTWTVTWDAPEVSNTENDVPEGGSDREDKLDLKLLQAYQKSVQSWKCKCMPHESQEGEIPGDDLRRVLTDKLTQMQIIDDVMNDIVCLDVPANYYVSKVSYVIMCKPLDYADQKYLCSVECPDELFLASYVEAIDSPRGAKYHTTWNNQNITFTLKSKSVTDSVIQRGETFGADIWKRIKNFGHHNRDNDEDGGGLTDRLLKFWEQEDASQQAAQQAAAAFENAATDQDVDPAVGNEPDLSDRLLAMLEPRPAANL